MVRWLTATSCCTKAVEPEYESFRTFVEAYGPEKSILLVDTYDVYACANTVIRICEEFGPVKGIRLDSGDVMTQAHFYRRRLDNVGLCDVKIFASNGFDTATLRQIHDEDVPIDGVLVGERLLCVADAPVTGFVYKMVEMGGVPTGKFAEGKVAYPFEKNVVLSFGTYTVSRERQVRCDSIGEAMADMAGRMLLPIFVNGMSTTWLGNECHEYWRPTDASFSDEIKEAYEEIGRRHKKS